MYYKNKNGVVYNKTYYKKSKTGFYINGDSQDGVNSIFKKMKATKFYSNLKDIGTPENILNIKHT